MAVETTRRETDDQPEPQPQPAAAEARIERAVGRLYAFLERHRLTRTPWAVIQTFSKAEGALLSGSMAYYTFLSLFPLLMLSGFIAATISRFNVDAREALATGVEQVIPVAKGLQIVDQLVNARVALGIVGLLTLAYSASGFVGALTACLNRMWDAPKGRNPVGQKLMNLGIVAALGVVLIGWVSVTLWASDQAREALEGRSNDLVGVIQWVASPLSLFFLLLVLYRFLPACAVSWRSQLPGAAVGAVAIEVLKWGFAFWARHSAGVGAVPRSVLSIVLILVWLGLLSQAILYGAAVNVVLQDRRRRRAGHEPTAS